MLTTDIALKADPVYERIARRFRQHAEPLSRQDIAARKDRLLLPD